MSETDKDQELELLFQTPTTPGEPQLSLDDILGMSDEAEAHKEEFSWEVEDSFEQGEQEEIEQIYRENQQLRAEKMELEKALAESENLWQSQKALVRTADTLIIQQNEELKAAQAQLNMLLNERHGTQEPQEIIEEQKQELQKLQQRLARADTLILQQNEELKAVRTQLSTFLHETHSSEETQEIIEEQKQELQKLQQQLAHVERQCVLLQQKQHEQAGKLQEKEEQIQELTNRLARQQRYTLQYKAALAQYLSGNALTEITNEAPAIVSPPPEIQPWSAPPQKEEQILLQLTKDEGKLPEVPLPVEEKTEAEVKLPPSPPMKKQESTLKQNPVSSQLRLNQLLIKDKPKSSRTIVDLPKFVRK